MRALVALLAALLGAPAHAAPCDRFSEALAYNACLARQGPAAKAVPLRGKPAAGDSDKPRRATSRFVVSRPHGRAEMVFTPGK